jgi:signal transduction histidine kinase
MTMALECMTVAAEEPWAGGPLGLAELLERMHASKAAAGSLEDAFVNARMDLAAHCQIEFRLVVEGLVRPLRANVRNEVYRIGLEALTNAFRHSRATDIEIELEYGAGQLRLSVRDNGVGLDARTFSCGGRKHSGISKMKEQAEQIGGTLRVLSHPGAGTEVELKLGGPMAYPFSSEPTSLGWLSRLFC